MPLRDSWKAQGRCNKVIHPDVDPELWWPNGTTGDEEVKIIEAKRLCDDCPVKARCLAWAVEERQYFGIWGGTTEEERRDDRREARKIMAQQVDRQPEPQVA